MRTLDEKIKKCEKQIKSKATKAFGDFDVLDKHRNAAVERGDNLDSLADILEQAREDVAQRLDEVPDKSAGLDSPDKEVVAHIRDTYDRVLELLGDSQDDLAGVGVDHDRRRGRERSRTGGQ